MKTDNVIIKQMYPYITKNLSDPKVRKKIMKYIGEFIDRNSKGLYVAIPIEKMYILDSDREFFYKLLDVNPKEIQKMIMSITFINKDWKALSKNDFIFIILNCIIYFHRNKLSTEETAMNLYLIIHDYIIYFLQYFRYIQPQVMEYTINNLNNKHDIKKLGSVFKVLVKKINKYRDGYTRLLKSNDDKNLVDYLGNLNTRVKGWVKVLMLEYKANKDSGKYFITDSESFEDDNYRETTNNMVEIESLTSRTVRKIFTHPVDLTLMNTVTALTQVSKSTLITTLGDIRRKGSIEDITTIVRNIIVVFVVDSKRNIKDIHSKDFINTLLMIYNVSNTTNERIIEVKAILDKILIQFNRKYVATNREPTRVNWRKSIYLYLAMFIQMN